MTHEKRDSAPTPDWLAAFPSLNRLTDPVWLETLHAARETTIAPDTVILQKGSPCAHCHLLVKGTLRIYEVAECGREIVLYRVHPGEMCILNLTNMLEETAFPLEVATEGKVHIVKIPMRNFQQLMAHSTGFRNFVITTLARRMNDMMRLVEQVVFQRLDLRLACQLSQLFLRHHTTHLGITHQELAHEIGTSREVVSRLLKEFEHKGCVRLHRGEIELVSAETLDRLSR